MSSTNKKLGDIADLLVGFAFKSQQFRDASEEGIRLVRGDNVQQGYLRWGEKAKKWNSDEYGDYLRYQLKKDDVILAMDRPVVGGGLKLAWVKEQDLPCLLVQRVTRIRGLEGLASTAFIRYALSAPEFLAHIESITTGANIPHISGKDIASYALQLPSLDTQDRIVEVLSAYDDLIESNLRRIALLEESARLLYREWFVDLRFRGAKQAVNGAVPEGWEPKALSEVVTINPKTPFEKGRHYPFVPMQALAENSMTIGESDERIISGGAKFQNMDTLLARITPCLENGKTGLVQFLPEEAPVGSGSTEFIVMRSKTVSPYWVYCLARDEDFREHAIRSMSGADGRQRVNIKCFDSYMVLQPPQEVLDAFDCMVRPMFELVETLARENKVLRLLRDALLPKLMSGALPL